MPCFIAVYAPNPASAPRLPVEPTLTIVPPPTVRKTGITPWQNFVGPKKIDTKARLPIVLGCFQKRTGSNRRAGIVHKDVDPPETLLSF